MKALPIRLDVWQWRGTGLLLVLVLALLATLTMVPGSDVLSTAPSARNLLIGASVLTAGVFLHLHWRLTAKDTTGWLALVLTVAAVPPLAIGAFSLTHPDDVARQTSWLFVFWVATMLGLIATVVLSRRVRFRGDPLAAGLLVGLTISAVRQLVVMHASPLTLGPGSALLTTAVTLALTAGLAVAVTRLTELPRWVRLRFAAGLLLLGVVPEVGGTLGLVTGLVGAVLLAWTAALVLHQAIEDEKQQVA